MTMREELEFLANFLEKCAKEKKREQERATDDYREGVARGEKQAYELCARWIKEALEKEDKL